MAVRMVLAGGGTGGHVYPALAIAEIARQRLGDVELLFVGVRGRAEEHIVPAAGIPIEYVRARGLPSNPLLLPGFGADLARGVLAARRILGAFDPDIVVSTGGYSSAPAVLSAAASRSAGRPAIFVHEQNAAPGRMNRLAGRLADRVGTTFESSGRFFPADKVVHTGYPVRGCITSRDRKEARRSLGVPDDAFVILAFGGSGGARSLNRGLVDALPSLLVHERVHVIHGTGRYHGTDYDPASDTRERVESLGLEPGLLARYHPTTYIEDMGNAYAGCDLALSRAGAGTLSELRASRTPAVLVPKMGLPHEHQLANALELEGTGCAIVVREERGAVAGGELARVIGELLSGTETLERMRASLADQPAIDTSAVLETILEDLVKVSATSP